MSTRPRWRRIVPAGVLIGVALGVGYFTATNGQTPDRQPPSTEPLPPPAVVPTPPAPSSESIPDLVRAGRYDEAMAAMDKRPGPNVRPRIELAGMLAEFGNPPAARYHVELAAAEYPDNPDVYLLNGRFAVAERRPTDALLSFDKAIALAESLGFGGPQTRTARVLRDARLGKVNAYELRPDWPAARDILAELAAESPKDYAVRDRLATAMFHAGQPEDAMAEFRTLANADPKFGIPELRMALLSAAEGDAANAEDWFRTAVAANPVAIEPTRTYAAWLLDAGRPADAEPVLATAERLDPDGPVTRTLRGVLARTTKDFATAERVFETLHMAAPDDPSAAWNLALTLSDSADPVKRGRAVELAEASAKANPQSTEAFAVLGWCYRQAGRPADAERALAAAASAGEVRLDTRYFMARVLADRGDTAAALGQLNGVLESHGPFVFRADAVKLKAELEAGKRGTGRH